MKKVGEVIITKLPLDDFVGYFDFSGHTEDKEILSALLVASVDIETDLPASVASIEGVDGNIVQVRFTGGLENTNYKCTVQAQTNVPSDIYHLEVFLYVVPWQKDAKQLTKQPDETFVEGFDCEDILGGSDDGSGNAILTLSVSAVDNDTEDPANVALPAGIDGSLAKVRLFGGVSGHTYRCTLIVTGNSPDRTFGEVFFMNVVDY